MEIKVYANFDARSVGKCLYCVRVSVPAAFDYQKTVDVLHCLYGSDKVIEILVV